MSTMRCQRCGNVVSPDAPGRCSPVPEGDATWFESAPCGSWPGEVTARGKLTVVAVNRGEPGAGVVTLDGAPVELLRWDSPEAKRAADDWAAGKVEPEPPTSGGPNRHARRAAKRGGR